MVVVAAEKVLLMRIAKASDDDIAAERVHDEIAARMHVHRAARDVAAKPNGVLELHARDDQHCARLSTAGRRPCEKAVNTRRLSESLRWGTQD